jgi:Na+-translocating ferredoxin:NAD+ oxidoreductase RNF subunit RnfB
MTATLLTAVAALGGLTFILATLLILASRVLHVEEDPRLDIVEDLLPHSNCGACGYPGCRGFAEALVAGSVQPAGCTVGSSEEQKRIADLLGVAVGEAAKVVARLACAGGNNVARRRAVYRGFESCVAASHVAGGGKDCYWGCLGFGDCERVCDFDAIVMDEHSLPRVIEDACTACGDCVEVCPKDLFSLQNADNRLWVRCKNEELGDFVLAACEVACTACGRCAVDAPTAVSMVNNLPVVDYSRLRGGAARETGQAAIERCPTGAIVWVDALAGDIKGRESARVIRQSARAETVT